MEKLLTVKEAQIILQRSRVSLWRDRKEGRIQFVKIGGSIRIPEATIYRLVNSKDGR